MTTFSPSILGTLKQIALDHRKKLAATFSLVAAENLLLLLYPLVGSLAVNAVLNHNVWQALLYAVMVFAIWAVGSVVMLLIIEFWTGLLAFFVLLSWGLALPHYAKLNDRLYFKLNNRLENEVSVIEQGSNHGLTKHYGLLAKLRIAISNREALSFLLIGISLCVLFGSALAMLSLNNNVTAGHIYAVLTYLWSFAFSLDDMPRLVEKFSELKDIGKRVEV
ncbi:ABC transporter six-transmembrane domain-containing protein [Mannheimia bovis]|uniref:ABC transporter six-transmembrane domain-containing protein n=1 Tax=Mannheimia TaxID=75984 RepID=UPI0024B7C99B|nr:ABC transporter six-transmembrane domain-containing protein [Mannheimia bovis]WHP46723.1 ABC transporter six-transmembrane domain-containing protein [Mannheimia bovis]